MKVSFFETARYLPPRTLPSERPVPSGTYDRDAGAEAYRSMIALLGPLVPHSDPVRVAEELAGHAISTDRPEAFAKVVVDFLERHEAFVISRTQTVIHP